MGKKKYPSSNTYQKTDNQDLNALMASLNNILGNGGELKPVNVIPTLEDTRKGLNTTDARKGWQDRTATPSFDSSMFDWSKMNDSERASLNQFLNNTTLPSDYRIPTLDNGMRQDKYNALSDEDKKEVDRIQKPISTLGLIDKTTDFLAGLVGESRQDRTDRIATQQLYSEGKDKNAIIDSWIDPNRKMSKSEVAQAKQFIQDYEIDTDTGGRNNYTQTDRERMSALKDKVSKSESAVYGVMNAIPGMDAMGQKADDNYYGWELSDFENEVAKKTDPLSAETQSKVDEIDKQISALENKLSQTNNSTGDLAVDEALGLTGLDANGVVRTKEEVDRLKEQKYRLILGDTPDPYGYKARKENAQKQNKFEYLAGDLSTRAIETAIGNNLMNTTQYGQYLDNVFKADTSVSGKVIANALKDAPIDLVTDTLPEYLSNKSSGMSDAEVNKQLLINIALNMGINLGVSGIQNLSDIKAAIKASKIDDTSKQVLEEIADAVETEEKSIITESVGSIDDYTKKATEEIADEDAFVDTFQKIINGEATEEEIKNSIPVLNDTPVKDDFAERVVKSYNIPEGESYADTIRKDINNGDFSTYRDNMIGTITSDATSEIEKEEARNILDEMSYRTLVYDDGTIHINVDGEEISASPDEVRELRKAIEGSLDHYGASDRANAESNLRAIDRWLAENEGIDVPKEEITGILPDVGEEYVSRPVPQEALDFLDDLKARAKAEDPNESWTGGFDYAIKHYYRTGELSDLEWAKNYANQRGEKEVEDFFAKLIAENSDADNVVKNIVDDVDPNYIKYLEEGQSEPISPDDIPYFNPEDTVSSREALVTEAKNAEGAYKRSNSTKGKILDDKETKTFFGKKSTLNNEMNLLANTYGKGRYDKELWELKDLINQYNATGDERFYREAMRYAEEFDEAFAGKTYSSGRNPYAKGTKKNTGITYEFGKQSDTFTNLTKQAMEGKRAVDMPGTEEILSTLKNLDDTDISEVRKYASYLGEFEGSQEDFDYAYTELIAKTRKLINDGKITTQEGSALMDAIEADHNSLKRIKEGVSDIDLYRGEDFDDYMNSLSPLEEGAEPEIKPTQSQNALSPLESGTPGEPIEDVEDIFGSYEKTGNEVVSQMYDNSLKNENTGIFTDEQKGAYKPEEFTHLQATEKDTLAAAETRLEDFAKCEEKYLNSKRLPFGMDGADCDTMMGMIRKYNTEAEALRAMGDYYAADALEAKSQKIYKRIYETAKKNGRFNQALAKYSRNNAADAIDVTEMLKRGEAGHLAAKDKKLGKAAEQFKKDVQDEIDPIWEELKKASDERFKQFEDKGRFLTDEETALTRDAIGDTINKSDAQARFEEAIRNALDKSTNKTLKKNMTDTTIQQLARKMAIEMETDGYIDNALDWLYDAGVTGFSGIDESAADAVRAAFEEAKKFNYGSKDYALKLNEAYSILADATEMQGTFADKVKAWRYMAMLGKPTVIEHNVIGNTGQGVVATVKDDIATALEHAFIKDPEKRTKALAVRFTETDAYKAAKEIADNYDYMDLTSTGGMYSRAQANTLQENAKVFNQFRDTSGKGLKSKVNKALNTSGKALNKANDVVGKTLDDYPWLKDSYADNLVQYLKSHKVENIAKYISDPAHINDDLMREARQYAINQAKKNTFHTETFVGKVLTQIENSGTVGRVLVGGVMPFKNTPANIVKTMASYSPLNSLKVTADIADMVKHAGEEGVTTAAELIDDIAETVTGTMGVMLGYSLAKKGIITSERSKSQGDHDKTINKQQYSLHIGKDLKFNIDLSNCAPWSIPLLSGASFYQGFEGSSLGEETRKILDAIADSDFESAKENLKGTREAIKNASTHFFDPIIENSMLKSISDMLTTASYADTSEDKTAGAKAMAGQAVSNYFGQFVPSAVGGLSRGLDNTKYSSYNDNDSLALRTFNQAKNKIPGANKLIENSENILNAIPYVSDEQASKWSKDLRNKTSNYASVNGWGKEKEYYTEEKGNNALHRTLIQELSPLTTTWTDKTDNDVYLEGIESQIREQNPYANDFSGLYPSENYKNNFTYNNEKYTLTAEENHDFAVTKGTTSEEIINALRNSDRFNSLPDPEAKYEAIMQAYNVAEYVAQSEVIGEEYKRSDDAYETYSENGVDSLVDYLIDYAKAKSIGITLNSTTESILNSPLGERGVQIYSACPKSDSGKVTQENLCKYIKDVEMTDAERGTLLKSVVKRGDKNKDAYDSTNPEMLWIYYKKLYDIK